MFTFHSRQKKYSEFQQTIPAFVSANQREVLHAVTTAWQGCKKPGFFLTLGQAQYLLRHSQAQRIWEIHDVLGGLWAMKIKSAAIFCFMSFLYTLLKILYNFFFLFYLKKSKIITNTQESFYFHNVCGGGKFKHVIWTCTCTTITVRFREFVLGISEHTVFCSSWISPWLLKSKVFRFSALILALIQLPYCRSNIVQERAQCISQIQEQKYWTNR